MSIQAVCLDAGNTLIHVTPSVGHVYAGEAERFGVNADPEALEQAFRAEWADRNAEGAQLPLATSEAREREWWRSIVEAAFRRIDLLESFGVGFEDYFDHLYEQFVEPDVWRVYADVTPALEALADVGMRLAVVSNWDSRLPRLLTNLQLAERFEFILPSAQAGFAKPDPRIFEAALRKLNLPASAVLHVGDALKEDVQGARRAGLKGVLLDRAGEGGKGDWPVVRSLTELVDCVHSG